MGMLLRRHDRKADQTPTVNGKPVNQEPKKKSLTSHTNSNSQDQNKNFIGSYKNKY
jgi:hypothetical protein